MTQKEIDKAKQIALKQAYKAYKEKEIPVGCCIIIPQENDDATTYDYISAYNQVEKSTNPFNHAEILAILKCIKKYSKKHFIDATIVVTLEPCPVCYHALKKVGIKEIYFMLTNEQEGAYSTNLVVDPKSNFHYQYSEEYEKLFTKFFEEFKEIRKEKIENRIEQQLKR